MADIKLRDVSNMTQEVGGGLIRSNTWNSNFSKLKDVINENNVVLEEKINGTNSSNISSTSIVELGQIGDNPTTILEQLNLIVQKLNDKVGTTKYNSEVPITIKDVIFNTEDNSFKFIRTDGAEIVIETLIEKFPIRAELVEENGEVFIKLINEDGSFTKTNISNLLTQYQFENNGDVVFNITSDISNVKKVNAGIKNGSVLSEHLHSTVLSDIGNKVDIVNSAVQSVASMKNEVSVNASNSKIYSDSALDSKNASSLSETNALSSSTLSRSYAVGDTKSRVNEETDNAKYYSSKAKEYADLATSKYTHDAGDITSGTFGVDRLPIVPINKGGTGANTVDEARANLNAISLKDITNYLKHADSLEISIKPYLNEGTQTPYTSGVLHISSNNSPLTIGGRMTTIESQGNSIVKSNGEAKLESNTRATVYSPIEAKLEGNIKATVNSPGDVKLSGGTTTIGSQTKTIITSDVESRLTSNKKAVVYSPIEAKLEGATRVVVSSSGTISLSGKTTTIESQDNATIKGGAVARLEGNTSALVYSPIEARLEGTKKASVFSPSVSKMYGGTTATLQSVGYICQATEDDIKIGNIASTNAYYVNSGGCGQYSDESFKENIDYDLSSDLEKFSQLKPAMYNIIGGDKKTRGVIAQDVKEVYPELVDVIDDEGHMGVQYNALFSIALAKIQQLEKRIEVLESK